MNKKLFLAATLLFAIMGSVSKAAPTMLEARGNYMASNDTIIDDNVPVEIPAQYPGGKGALFHFIKKSTKYPTVALFDETQGEAVVEFCVKEDGTIGEVFMLKSLSPECDKALMDAVRKLKRFVPAKVAGKPACVWFRLPVSFKLEFAKEDYELHIDQSKEEEEAKGKHSKATEPQKNAYPSVIKRTKISGKIFVGIDNLECSNSRIDKF